jgi:broad specificity phosphatase PhoE
MSGRRLLLVRHGESEGNFERCFSPNPHIELTDRGVEQARAAGRRIAAGAVPVRIVSSPFRRALRTARLIADEIGFRGAIETEHDLRERDIGELAGKPYSWMREHHAYRPDRFWEWRPAGGESLVDVQRRAAPVLERLLAESGDDVLVVSHGGVMLALCAHVEGDWLRPKVARNCEVLVVERVPAGLALRSHGDPPATAGEQRDADTAETG